MNRSRALKVAVSCPRTLTSAFIAARRRSMSDGAAADAEYGLRLRRGQVAFLERGLPSRIEHLEREALQPVAEVFVRAVIDRRWIRSETQPRDRPPTTDWEDSLACASARHGYTHRSCCRRFHGWPSPSKAVLLCEALPCRATLRPSLSTSTSASVSVRLRPGSSTRTYRPTIGLPAASAEASSFGGPSSSGCTFG